MGRGRDHFGLLLCASAALLSVAGHARAQETPPPAPEERPAAPAEDSEGAEEDEIVIRAEQADQTRIDRRVYSLGADPISQSSTMLDVLSRLPSVTIAPSGAVRLLGSPNVTIQVDGQAVPGASLDQVLRSLTGSEIERIEVITNPSAAYAASGDGGIINIITRQRYNLGLTGSVSASAENTGAYQFNASPTFTRGAWSIGGRISANHNEWGGASTRVRETFATGDVINDVGSWEGEGTGLNGGAVLNYRPGERTRASFNLNGWDFEGQSLIAQDRSLNGATLYSQSVDNSNAVSGANANFDFQQSGDISGELFKLNLNLLKFENNADVNIDQIFASGAPDLRYITPTANSNNALNAKLDYERPFASGQLLALGGAFDNSQQDISTTFLTLAGAPIAPDYQSAVRGLQTTYALYGTYQFDAGSWTFLPGLRAEQYRREVRSPGGESDDTALDLFPSLHVRRNLTENLDLDLSYSRRIARRGINELDPAVRFFEVNRASSGNPDLQPTFTDAYEANVVYQTNDKTFNVTLYDRISTDIVSPFSFTRPDGVLLTMPVNAGESEQRGAQVIMRAPLFARGWRYAVSANLLNREFDVVSQGVTTRRSEMEYSGNAQIEYRDRSQSDPGADHVQLELQFQGPQYYLQGESDEFITANFTWRRRLTDHVAAVFNVQDIFDSAPTINELRTDDFFERSERRGIGTRARFTLTYSFGGAQQQGQPDAGPPAPMPAMPQ